MSITLLCLVKGNTLANAFPVDIDKDQLVGHLKEAIKVKKSPEFNNFSADRLKLWKTEKPPKRNIHIIVSPPEATTASSREQELLDEVASLKALLNKSTHAFDVVVSPKQRKSFTWAVNIEEATLDSLKEHICKMEKQPAPVNDGAVLKIVNDSGKYTPLNDKELREVLQLFVSDKNLKFTVFIETPSKPFNEWTFPKFITGRNRQGNLDYAIECHSTNRIVGLVEVKKDDFKQGFAQATVQMESSLSRKRKAGEIDDEYGLDKVWQIVTDAEKWYFMECILDNEGKLSFKLSKPVIVVYDDAYMETKVKKVLSHIVWLLDEAQKPDSNDSQSEEMVIKKHRSSSNLTGKSDK
ncbi:hypothetical protein RhiirA5_431281 [Rhizophagus irregularis]|uniref:Crinkler effector protein N-terminal domain-containing protein n=1 Tax=Rhizophagus irregularis TaxID=588596 RepID=A0A2N0NVB8_9GLOM|nr:hypothetical protein RhiirA5_431281 [Rhizophagus irregularis]